MVSLKPGIVLKQSCVVTPKTYALLSLEGQQKTGEETIPTFVPALKIQGNNIVVDFQGATLQGTDKGALPDVRRGLGLEVVGNNITIKNLNVHGYKVGLLAHNSKNLKLLNSDFSYNWKQRLKSTREKEDESDWMSYHHNEHDEWLRYGAAVYLRDVQGFEAHGVRAVGGQCGLMMTRCSKGLVWENNFSFLSGIGVGLYRTSQVSVAHNHIDWCVRGYSDGVYNRGQDSAGILVFEQSSGNVFGFNSVTHGGDGFFLWAGQTTMDSGAGGCNDNVVFGNDFSHAPTNGIEITFSRNAILNNLVRECWHGVWGGYSFDTKLIGNWLLQNQVGIAIEHGQNNDIQQNVFQGGDVGVQLWQNKSQDPNWGYPKHHDTVSHGYKLTRNDFIEIGKPVSVRDSQDVSITSNLFAGNSPALSSNGENKGLVFSNNLLTASAQSFPGVVDKRNVWNLKLKETPRVPEWKPELNSQAARIYPMKGAKMPFLSPSALRGRKYILVTEWGPYDFKSPILWPRDNPKSLGAVRHYEILGPKGTWRFVRAVGARVSATSQEVPGSLEATLDDPKNTSFTIELEYTGEKTTDYRGVITPAGKPVIFGKL